MALKTLALLGTLFALPMPSGVQEQPSGLVRKREIPIEGGGGFDYLTVDPEGGRLYLAHSPKIEVIDLKTGSKVGEVTGVEGAHGAVAVSDLKRGYATAGAKARLVVFNLETLKAEKEVETGQGPDGFIYLPGAKEVWTFNGRAKSVTCVDAGSLEVKATIALGGKPEAAAEDAERGLVYVNLEDQSSIAVINIAQHSVAGTHPVAPGEEPTGLAYDAKNHLVFAGCGNKKMVAIDVATWKVVGTADIGDHCDGVAFDPGTGNAYASCRDVTKGLHAKSPTEVVPISGLETPGGKTCALDPKTHTLYVSSGPRRGEKGALKILVFGPP